MSAATHRVAQPPPVHEKTALTDPNYSPKVGIAEVSGLGRL